MSTARVNITTDIKSQQSTFSSQSLVLTRYTFDPLGQGYRSQVLNYQYSMYLKLVQIQDQTVWFQIA